MTEINNKITNIGVNNPEYSKKAKEIKEVPLIVEEQQEINDIKDTGVLGRSLVGNNSDISGSVEKAVSLAKNNPDLLAASEEMFNSVYNQLITSGLEPKEAYMKALLAEEELLAIAHK